MTVDTVPALSMWVLAFACALGPWLALVTWPTVWRAFVDRLQADLCDIRNDLVAHGPIPV